MKLKYYTLAITWLLTILFLTTMNKAEALESTIKFIQEKNGIKEYRLQNGLKVLLKRNPSIPLITFSVWQKAGSRNEIKGEYGLAHFLEHMMFKGTKKLKKGEISETINKLGGVYNAFTSTDCTTYYETISPKHLKKVIEIESDRFKNSIIDQDELNLERTVVLSELEGGLNNPVTLLDQSIRSKAYEVSPYKHPTIGYEEDVKAIDKNKMYSFYKKYYNPKNASIVLTGDFNESYALNLIKNYFGGIKNEANTANPDATTEDKPQEEEKRLKIKKTGTFKLVEIAYHIVDSKHDDIYPLNIIEEILIKGNKSRLKKTLIEKGLATEISGGAEVNADPGLFYILVSLTPKTSHSKVEKIILKEIEKLILEPLSEQEINGAKNRIKANYLFGIDGTLNQAVNIGYFDTINDWKQSVDWTNKISDIKKKEVENVLRTYFRKENRTIGYFIPIKQKGIKYETQPLSITRSQHYSKLKETDTKALHKNKTTNGFDFKHTKQVLKDGSTLIIYNRNDLPVTYISGAIKGGTSLLPKDRELNCELISRMLDKGSKNYPKEQIEDILDSTGSEINFLCDEESFRFKVSTINDNLNQTINLFTDLLLNPIFSEQEIKVEKEKLIAEIIENKDNTQEISRRRFTQLIYPKDHPFYSNDFDIDIKLIKKINNNSLTKDHETLIKNNKAIITIVTNLNQQELSNTIKQIEENLSVDKKKEEATVKIPDTLLRENTKTDTIEIKDKAQTDVYLGHAGNISRTSPDYYKVHIANYILGGSSLASRLSKKVRDNSGLVYTIYSYVSATSGKGEFGIYFGSNPENIDKAIELIQKEYKEFIDKGITEEELTRAKASLIDSFITRNLSTNKNIASTFTVIDFYKLGKNYINKYPSIINSLKLKEVNIAIKKYFFHDKLNVVITGSQNKPK